MERSEVQREVQLASLVSNEVGKVRGRVLAMSAEELMRLVRKRLQEEGLSKEYPEELVWQMTLRCYVEVLRDHTGRDGGEF